MYYDDSDYDYMQHLRGVGDSPADISSTLVEAPRKNDVKGKGRAAIELRDDSDEEVEGMQTYKEYLESTYSAGGLDPDMDPTVREVLEALEDEAYVEDELDYGGHVPGQSNFFDDLLKGKTPSDFHDPPMNTSEHSSTFATRDAKFESTLSSSDDDVEDGEQDDDMESEGGDTIAELQAASARRIPRQAGYDRRSIASSSAFSMSSSSMFRNDGLRTLDDRFDQVEAMYDDDSDSESDQPDELPSSLQDIMDEFLTSYEIHGGKLSAVVGGAGATPSAQLDMLRSEIEKMQVLDNVKRQEREETLKLGKSMKEDLWAEESGRERANNKWDCETILSTYSNLENHPRLLRLRAVIEKPKKDKRTQAKIVIDPKTGFPVMLQPTEQVEVQKDSDSEGTMQAIDEPGTKRSTISRPRNETLAEKKTRKILVKEDRQSRRAEKRSTKETFGQERKKQQRFRQDKLKDASDVGKGNIRGIEIMRLS